MANSNKKRKSSRVTTSKRSAKPTKSEIDETKGSPSAATTSPYKLLMILSPAKTLNLDDGGDYLPEDASFTKPLDELKSQRKAVVSAMKGHASSASKLGALLKTSQKITSAAQEYWQDMSGDASSGGSSRGTKPSIFMFNGAAYSGLDILTMATKSNLDYLQDHLRIVDPLYGWLRPMDEVMAYRLEMATKGVFGKATKDENKLDPKIKLEDYWKPGILDCIEQEEESTVPIVIVNLASDEYSAAVDVPTKRIVKVVFKHGGRTIAVHAKRARGLMVRYMATNAVQSLDQLLDFDLEGYTFRPKESTYQKGGDVEFSVATLGSLRRQDEEESSSPSTAKKAKTTKKKKELPLTLVFDRPGDWTRPKK